MDKITPAEFEKRLTSQCLSGGGRGLPRKDRDKLVLYRSILLTCDADKAYPEKELNAVLKTWLSGIGQAIEVDHVTLRRHLVDEGYLTRDAAGTAYTINLEHMADQFEPAVNLIDPAAVIAAEVKRREERKKQYQSR